MDDGVPAARDPNKALASFWMHREIYTALGVVSKMKNVTMTRYILEALAEKMGFTLTPEGRPVGLDLERLTREAFEEGKKRAGAKRPRKTAKPVDEV